MSYADQLKDEIEQGFIDKSDDWQRYLLQVNGTLQRFNPDIKQQELYTYDELCKCVLDFAVEITQKHEDNDEFLPPPIILKYIYTQLIVSKVKDANVKLVEKSFVKQD